MHKSNSSTFIDGKIEGAPHLKNEHYPVFDTASTCGTGSRLISPQGHVKMIAAITPHISGAISKTVNLHNSSDVDDIKSVFYLAWELGVKAITIYRDGCKISQPLNAVFEQTEKQGSAVSVPVRVKPFGIRSARVHEAAINGLKLYITTSFYPNGSLGEIYVSSGKQGSLAKGLLDSLSTTISKMLQYGVPPKDIASMYRGHKFEPSGFVTGHPYIKSVDSISDLISKIIDIEIGDYTYCQIKPYEDNVKNNKVESTEFIYGEICPNCKGVKMIRNGTCKVCADCGSTTGCS